MAVPKLRFKEFKDEYNAYRLSDIVDFYKGNTLSKSDIKENGKFPCILYGELYTKYNEITDKVISYTDRNDKNLFYSKINDVIIPCSGETALDISTSTCILEDNVILGGDLNVLRPKFQNGKYLSYLLSNKKKLIIAKYAQGDSIVHLYGEKIKNIDIELPTIEEQKKVSKFLEFLNKKIELQQKKIEALKIYKIGLIQESYNNNCGNKIKMKDLIIQKSIRNAKNEVANVYSVSNKEGFILQSEQFKDRTVASEYTQNYKIVEKNDFAYNPARINVGSIARMKQDVKGIISPMYICFRGNEKIIPEYLEYFFKSYKFTYEMNKRLEGSVRMCLSYESMINIPIELPCIEEQRKVSDLFNSVGHKINQEESKLKKLNEIKKGLLQKMFI